MRARCHVCVLLYLPGQIPSCRPSRDVLSSNTALSRLLQQRLQQLQRCDATEGSVEIKRHATKALAAIRSVASCDSHAAPADDESFMRQDAKCAPSSSLHAADTAAAAPPTSSLMSLKAQRVTSGTLPPPPSLSLPWTTSSHPTSTLVPPAVSAHSEISGGLSSRNGNGDTHPSNFRGSGSSCDAADAPPPEYSARRYNPLAEDVKERVDLESEGQSIRQDRGDTRWHSAAVLPKHAATQQQPLSAPLPAPQQQHTPPASAVRQPSPSPSPSSNRNSPSLPSLLDSIALASAGRVCVCEYTTRRLTSSLQKCRACARHLPTTPLHHPLLQLPLPTLTTVCPLCGLASGGLCDTTIWAAVPQQSPCVPCRYGATRRARAAFLTPVCSLCTRALLQGRLCQHSNLVKRQLRR